MLKITVRVLIILLISSITGIGIIYIVNHVIQTTSNALFDGWTDVFKWLRSLSSLGWVGIIVRVILFILITMIVLGIERLCLFLKK